MRYKYTVQQLEVMANNPWLSDREREVFTMFYIRGWEIERIAAELYCDRRTIDNVLRSIRQKTA